MEGLNGLWNLLTQFANSDMGQYLPISPIQRWVVNWEGVAYIQKYLKYVNWFIPVSTIVNLLGLWLLAIGVFYGGSALLRWLNIID